MARTILVTAGISLVRDNTTEKENREVGFESLPRPVSTLTGLHEELKRADQRHATEERPFNHQHPTWVKARQALVETLGRLWDAPSDSLTEREKRLYSGAELASLERLGRGDAAPFARLQTGDRVILLASDTAPGLFCAWLLHDALQEGAIGLPRVDARVEHIAGLRPDDAERFLAQGLPEAARVIFEYHQPGQQTLLITSGGYKGLLPYLSPVAMQLEIPMLYLYEESDEMLEIRHLPVAFNLRVIKTNKGAFGLIEPPPRANERPFASADEFWDRVRHEGDTGDEKKIRDLGLVEELKGLDAPRVRLSPTGVLALLLAYRGKGLSEPTGHGGPLV